MQSDDVKGAEMETPLACPDGPDIFMRVLIRERQEGEREAGV